MVRSRISLIVIGLCGLAAMTAALILLPTELNRSSRTMPVAADLLALQVAMSDQSLSGFLPGNHPRLSERLRKKRFTSVIVLPMMVSGLHSVNIVGLRCGTAIVLIQTSGRTNHWTISRDLFIGSRYWKSEIGTIERPSAAPAPDPAKQDLPTSLSK